MIKSKKSLGQNFLVDKNICKKIINFCDIEDKKIIEIGPGYGALTDFIIKEKPSKLILIEKDKSLYGKLVEKYKNISYVEIYCEDALNFNFNKYNDFNVIANLPYNISTKIILKLLKLNNKINLLTFMIQKELAEKFNYKTTKINKYKFITQLVSSFKICFSVSPSVFLPKPKIYSSVVRFELKKINLDWEKIDYFVNIIFKNKRKKISNSFKKLNIKYKPVEHKRLEELTFEELFYIYNTI